MFNRSVLCDETQRRKNRFHVPCHFYQWSRFNYLLQKVRVVSKLSLFIHQSQQLGCEFLAVSVTIQSGDIGKPQELTFEAPVNQLRHFDLTVSLESCRQT